jgi:hypothetical protein
VAIYFLSISQQVVSADITKNSAVANIEMNIFTVLEKDLKNVSERTLAI